MAGPSFTPVDTFAAPPQRPVVQREQLNLQGLIDMSDTLRGVRAAEAKDELAFEKDLAQEYARRALEGESFGQIIKDLLGTEGTPAQTKAKLVRMQRDGRISATESPVFLSLVDDAKTELLTQRAGEAVNRRATDIVKAGRAAAALYSGAEDVDLKVQQAIAAKVDEIIADEVGIEGDARSGMPSVALLGGEERGLSDRAARRLSGTLDTLAADLEVKAYIMLQEEMEEDLLTDKTEVSAKQAMDIVEALNGDESHSFSANDRGPLKEQLQRDLMVFADSGKKDYHAAFEDGPIRTYINAFRQIDDPSERQEALEGLMAIATELTGPGGVKPYSGATKRSNRVSTMIQKEIRESRRAATAESEITTAAQVEAYVAENVDPELLMVDVDSLTQEERLRLYNVVEKATDGQRARVARHIDTLRAFYKANGPSTAATPENEASFTLLAGEGGELREFGERRAEFQALFERSPNLLASTLTQTYGLTALQAAKVTNMVRGFKRESVVEASKWQSTANAVLKNIEAGRPILLDAEGTILNPVKEGAVVADRKFGADLKNEMYPRIQELEAQIEAGELDALTALRQFQQETNDKITARQQEIETDTKVLTDQQILSIQRADQERARGSASDILYDDPQASIPERPVDQLGFSVGDIAFAGSRRDRQRRALALGVLLGFDAIEEDVQGDVAASIKESGKTVEELEAQGTAFANNLMLETLTGDYRRQGLSGLVTIETGAQVTVQQAFESRFRQELFGDLPRATGLSQAEREGIGFGREFNNLYERMAESSPLFSFADGQLEIDYTRLSLPRLYNISQEDVSDQSLIEYGLAQEDVRVAPKRQFQDALQLAMVSFPELNISATGNIEEYRKNGFNDEALTRLTKSNPVWAYTKTVADELYQTKTGTTYNPNKKADRLRYGIVVAHVFSELMLLNQTIE